MWKPVWNDGSDWAGTEIREEYTGWYAVKFDEDGNQEDGASYPQKTEAECQAECDKYNEDDALWESMS